jgi:hypothetical protein
VRFRFSLSARVCEGAATVQKAVVVLAVMLVWGAPDAIADVVVIESHPGARPADADEILHPVFAELERRGVLTRQRLAERVERKLSVSAGTLSLAELVAAQRSVDDAYDSLIDGDYERARDKARTAVFTYARASGLLAQDNALRTLQFRAFVIAARSCEVLGETRDAFDLMAEAIRTFPERAVATTEFDPHVVALHARVRSELARRRGTLSIAIDDPTAVLFVNGRFVGTGAVSLSDTPEGMYRVVAMRGAQIGRVHSVRVNAGQRVSLSMSWSLDSRLRTSGPHVGFEHEAQLNEQAVRQLGRSLGADAVIVLEIRSLEGQRSVVGYRFDVATARGLMGTVPVASRTQVALARLGAKLAAEAASMFVHDVDGARRSRGRLGIALSGVGGLAIATGATFALLARSAWDDAKAICGADLECDTDRDHRLGNERASTARRRGDLATGFIAGGVLAGVGGLVLWWSSHHRGGGTLRWAPAVDTDGIGVTALGAF